MPKRKGLIESLDAVWSVAARIVGVAIALGAGVMGFFFSNASAWMEQYQPFSSYVAGLAGAMAASLVLLMITFCRKWWVSTSLDAKFAERSTVNPTKRIFENERVFLTDLANPVTGRIHKKTFSGCEIMGPANTVFIGSGQMIDSGFINCDFIAIKEGQNISNVIVVDECSFRECEFFRCSILGPSRFFDHISSGFSGINVISVEYQHDGKRDT